MAPEDDITTGETAAPADGQVYPVTDTRQTYFGSFAYRDYRLFWAGSLASNIGTWMQNYALGIVVFSFRGSEFDLGLVNFLSGIPVLFLALPAGALADRFDRRNLITVIQAVLLCQATALAVLQTTGVLSPADPIASLSWVASLGLIGGMAMAMHGPAFQSLVPELVPRSLMMNAIALNAAQFQGARLLGPLVAAGLVLLGADMGGVFFANAASFVFVIVALRRMRMEPPGAVPGNRIDAMAAEAADTPRGVLRATPASRDRAAIWAALTAGIRYARENRVVAVLLLSTALVTVFGFPYSVLLPAIVTNSLGATGAQYTQWTALIMAANGLGALAGALAVAGLPSAVSRHRVIPFGIVAFSLALTAFALAREFWLAVVISAFTGMLLVGVNSLTNTSVQAAAPGHIRGRVMALYVMAFLGMMPIAGLLAGTVGEFAGPSIAVIAGAVVLLVWGLTLVLRPSLLDDRSASSS